MDFKRDMIRLVGTKIHYRVPEDIFPIPAANMVACGRAEWVERHDPTLLEKAKALLTVGRQAAQDRRNRAETASLKRNAQTAARPRAPERTLIDTGAADFGADMSFENLTPQP